MGRLKYMLERTGFEVTPTKRQTASARRKADFEKDGWRRWLISFAKDPGSKARVILIAASVRPP
jgi:hypothetical protein